MTRRERARGGSAPRRRRNAPLALLAVPLSACKPTPAAPPPRARPLEARIAIRIPAGDGPVSVRWCLDGTPPAFDLRTRRQRRATVALEDGRGRPLADGGPFRPTPADRGPACFVHRLRADGLARETEAATGTRLLAVHDLLARPRTLPRRTTIAFDLPPGTAVTTAWPGAPTTGVFEPAPSVHRFPSFVAVGPRPPDVLDLPGGRLRVAAVGDRFGEDRSAVTILARDAARALVAVYGRLPRRQMALFARPSTWSETVGFGQLVRGGGAAVVLSVAPAARGEDLVGGWTATHEFLHAAMPFAADPWLGEGIASYYTEVARTRIGHRTEAEGWRALEDAFERGRRRGRGLALGATSRHMHALFAYQRVYWGGAAICFLLDVEIRRRTGNREGLDDAVRLLADLLDAPRTIPAARILARWEERYGPGLADLARRHLERRGFPDVSAAYAFLGVVHGDGRTRLDDTAPGAAIRRAIMAPRPLRTADDLGDRIPVAEQGEGTAPVGAKLRAHR